MKEGIENIETAKPITTTPSTTKSALSAKSSPAFKSNNIDIDYHDTIDNLLEKDSIHVVNYIENSYPSVSGNVTIKRVATQGNFIYDNPPKYKYDMASYVPNYEIASALSRTPNTPDTMFTSLIDLDEFSAKFSNFDKSDIPPINQNEPSLPTYGNTNLQTAIKGNTKVSNYSALANDGKQFAKYNFIPPKTTTKPLSVTLKPTSTPTPTPIGSNRPTPTIRLFSPKPTQPRPTTSNPTPSFTPTPTPKITQMTTKPI
jgi:hypothetical protein